MNAIYLAIRQFTQNYPGQLVGEIIGYRLVLSAFRSPQNLGESTQRLKKIFAIASVHASKRKCAGC